MRLRNKVVLITGAAGDIGKAAVQQFSLEGAFVMLADINIDVATSIADGLDNAAACQVDVTDPDSNRAMVEATLARFGRLDAFVANAGTESAVSSIEDADPADFDHVMRVNVSGPYLGCKYAVPALKKSGGGSILITSSGAGLKGAARLTPYTTSKHAVIGMMRSLALELGPSGIRVNTINPGAVRSRMMDSISAGFGPELSVMFDESVAAATPLGRYATPAELAPLMAFLISDEASFCTGGVFVADGGNSCG